MIIELPYLLLTGFCLDGNLIVLLLIKHVCKSVSVCEGYLHNENIVYQFPQRFLLEVHRSMSQDLLPLLN